MENSVFGKKDASSLCHRVDRFIPTRASLDERRRTVLQHSCADDLKDGQDFWYTNRMQQKRYATLIAKAFGVKQVPVSGNASSSLQPWPCVPRKDCFLTPADSVLDLPAYRHALFPDLLDWNSDDVLVAALGRKYHKWSWRSQLLVGRGITAYHVYCCKFDPRGELLALGMYNSRIEVHHNAISKIVSVCYCRCHVSHDGYECIITAVEWSPTGNSFVFGCSNACLSVYSRAGKHIHCRYVCHGSILCVRISPDARYLAVTAMAAKFVLILSWPSLAEYSSLDSHKASTVKTLNWHPWRSALLGVGEASHRGTATITLWDAPQAKLRQVNKTPSYNNVDAMLFSHLTGEMVLSLFHVETRNSEQSLRSSRLVVLSDPDTVVDQWGRDMDYHHHLDRIRTMVFSPDGTKLATASIGEDLIIWNFLPESKDKLKNTARRRFSVLPECMDLVTFGISLR